jgi:hypothetical protein
MNFEIHLSVLALKPYEPFSAIEFAQKTQTLSFYGLLDL